jgi:hypothetical protein
LSFLEEEKSVKTGEQNFLLPMFSMRPGEEEKLQCLSKRHRFGFFFLTVYETASF